MRVLKIVFWAWATGVWALLSLKAFHLLAANDFMLGVDGLLAFGAITLQVAACFCNAVMEWRK